MTEYMDGKLYRVTRTMRYDVRDNKFHGLDRPASGLIYLGVAAGALREDPSAEVELITDPLPTTPGSVIRTSQKLCDRARTLVRVEAELPWCDVNTNAAFSDSEVAGATVLFDAGAAS